MNPTPLLLASDMTLPAEEISSLVFFAKVVLSIGTLLGLVWSGISIWNMVRRDPSADQTFATKEDLAAVDARLWGEITKIQNDRKQSVKDLHDKFDHNFRTIEATLSRGMQDINRSIGQLEGSAKIKQELIEALKQVSHGR